MAVNPLIPPSRKYGQKKVNRSLQSKSKATTSVNQTGQTAAPTTVKKENFKSGLKATESADDYIQYPLKACTQDDIESIRTHILKFQSKNQVDPVTFTQPIRLHRKETRSLQYQLTGAEIELRQKEIAEEKARIAAEKKQREETEKANGGPAPPKFDISMDPNVAPEPVKTEEQKKLEKQEKRLAKIGPDANGRKGKQMKKKKTRQTRDVDQESKKLRYEEYYPWVMEDYDGKNTWVGSYEAGNTDIYALLVCDGNGFKMIPTDKVYKFTPRNNYSTLTTEEAEKLMEKKKQTPRWLMKHLGDDEKKMTRYERTQQKQQKLKLAVGSKKKGAESDNEDLDFDEDFADDEEAPIQDGNEQENKESEQRMKKEMRSANAMGLRDDIDSEVDDIFEDRKVDKEGEKTLKTLVKTEMNGLYDSDDDVNPYLRESDLEEEEENPEKIEVKVENNGTTIDEKLKLSPKSRKNTASPQVISIKVKSVNKPIGYVVFKALPSLLTKFPKGDWNPSVKKRALDSSIGVESGHKTKKIKLEKDLRNPLKGAKDEPFIKVEEGGVAEQNRKNTSVNDGEDVLVEKDILDIVTKEKVTTSELIHRLKYKLRTPKNKEILKVLFKKLIKCQDGILVLKEGQ